MNVNSSEQTSRYLEGQSRRDFPVDVFVSHNQDDTSREFAQLLVARGLTVWYDQYADLTDGKTRTVISLSLREARFVVLLIWNGFRDSQWCQAEYLPALQAERALGVPRVLIALLDPDVVVPSYLSACRQFPIYQEGVDPLVKFIKAANFVTARRLDSQAQPSQLSKIVARLTTRLNGFIRIDVEPLVTLNEDYVGNLILMLAKEEPRFIDELKLMVLREFLYHSTSHAKSKISVNERFTPAFLLLARLAYILAPNSDVRANALYIALWVGLTNPGIAARRTCISLLCREFSKEILQQGQVFANYVFEFTSAAHHLPVGILTTERDVIGIVEALNKRVSRITENERLRKYLATHSVLHELSFLEQTHLWRRRLAHACSAETALPEISSRDWHVGKTEEAALLFNISTTELALRELHDILFEGSANLGVPRQFGADEKDIYSVIADALDELVAISEKHQGKPLIFSAEHYIDNLLDVFTLLIASGGAYGDRMLRLAERVHELLEEHAFEQVKREVPSYTAYVQDIAQGTDRTIAHSRFIHDLLSKRA